MSGSNRQTGNSEKTLEWVFKISTGLVIPLLVWVFKMSMTVYVDMEKIRSDIRVHDQILKDIHDDIKEMNQDIKKLLDN